MKEKLVKVNGFKIESITEHKPTNTWAEIVEVPTILGCLVPALKGVRFCIAYPYSYFCVPDDNTKFIPMLKRRLSQLNPCKKQIKKTKVDLKLEEALQIRDLLLENILTNEEIADRRNVSTNYVQNIKRALKEANRRILLLLRTDPSLYPSEIAIRCGTDVKQVTLMKRMWTGIEDELRIISSSPIEMRVNLIKMVQDKRIPLKKIASTSGLGLATIERYAEMLR